MDLGRPKRLTGCHQLVTRGDHGHPRAPVYPHGPVAGSGEQGNGGGVQRPAAVQQQGTR